MFQKIKRRKFVTTGAVALLLCAAVAVAAVLLTGQKGAGRSHFRQLSNLTVTAGTAPSTGPYGIVGSEGDAVAHVANPNGVPVKVISVQRDSSGGQITSSDGVGCPGIDATLSVTATTLTVAQQTAATIPANGAADVLLPNILHVVSAPSAGCMAADFTVPLDLTVSAG
jgi:hypothetical protein